MILIVSSAEFYKREIGLTFFQEIGPEISLKNPRKPSGIKPMLSKNKDRGPDPL